MSLSCGDSTVLDAASQQCVCDLSSPPSTVDDDPNVLQIGGIFDATTYQWGPAVFDLTVQLLNQGEWGVLPDGMRIEYAIENSNCDETTAARSYWNLRTRNLHGIIGARCSGASASLARISQLEGVPQLSPASNSAKLSDDQEFPLFSRLVAPNNEMGEVGALIAMLRHFDWEKVGIISTDTTFAKDLTNEFKRLWSGQQNGWKGEVAYSDTVRINADGSANQESIHQVLASVPTDNPSANSRIIFLAAHSQHAFPILQAASESNFQPDTIWVGPSSWIGRNEHDDFSWLPSVPGYLGVSVLRNRDDNYDAFLAHLNAYEQANGQALTEELPTFAAEFVDSIRAMAWALVNTVNRRNGAAVVETLRQVSFDGVSGNVQLTTAGDRKNPQYTLINAQVGSNDGTMTWEYIGTTGTAIGSTNIPNGNAGLCFAEVGCAPKAVPSDTYPIPPVALAIWVIVLLVSLGVLLVLALLKYWRSRRSKKTIVAELDALRGSIVGMRASMGRYVPKSRNNGVDLEQGVTRTKRKMSMEKVLWMWKETPQCMDQHAPQNVYGDLANCWILYDAPSSKALEEAHQNRETRVSPLPGYVVNLRKMLQIKTETGFEREVQRIVDTSGSLPDTDDTDDSENTTDLSDVVVGDDLPMDLEADEPCMVLCEGDIIQISKQRNDGWAFGTKLYHSDENLSRQLVQLAVGQSNVDDANVLTDTGWFQVDKTRVPTADDLKTLQRNVGDAGNLEAPDHWSPVSDSAIVERHDLASGNPERVAVENAFLSTLRPPNFSQRVKVLKIERVQNLAMWQSYVVKRQTICHRDTSQLGNAQDHAAQQKALQRIERKWLFHGSNKEVMDKILQQGFNRSFCGKNATAYGKGVYFARDASYSAHQLYSVPDNKGNQYMMACRVVVGEYCRGKHDALTPDVRDARTHTLYDSTVGTGSDPLSDPSIFVTYHDSQAYPEYLITFRTY